MNIELKPAGHLYPSVVLTQEELDALLDVLNTEFEWNKNWKKDYPALHTASRKLEMYRDDYHAVHQRLTSSEMTGKTKRSKTSASL